MRSQSATHDNSSAPLDTWPKPRSPWGVVEVEAMSNYRLRVVFRDGLEGVVDMSALIHSADAGVFAALVDPSYFSRVGIALGAPTWPGQLDLAPDAIHDGILASQDRVYRLGAERARPAY